MVSGAARGTRDEGGRTKNRRQETEDRSIRAGEKEEIHIIKPSFCAERLWPAAVEAIRQSNYFTYPFIR